jgi:hypothetical protein
VRPAAVLLALLALALAGCSSDEEKTKPDPLHSYNGRVIRGWLLALERGDFQQAADYFAKDALIDQGRRPYRLRTRDLAINFNALLPCRADLIRLRGGGHARHVLATFRLRAGPGGDCTGLVRVRYTIVKGKFTEWIQGPDSDSDQPAPSEPA